MSKTQPDSKTLMQEEIIASLPSKPSGRLLLAPRFGKTKLMTDIIRREKPSSILWASPSAKLCEIDLPAEFVKWEVSEYLKSTTFVTYASLHKATGHYDMIVLDEEQCLTENNAINLISKNLSCNYMISMTGVPTEHSHKKELYMQLGLNRILYSVNINEAVEAGILSNYDITLVRVKLDERNNLLISKPQMCFWTSERRNYEYLSQAIETAKRDGTSNKGLMFRIFARMRFIGNSPSKLAAVKYYLGQEIKGKTLIFADNIKQAKTLCPYTFHSKTDDKCLKLFQEDKIERIAMVNSGGTGYTYKEIDNLVITQANSDKNGMVSQKISRTLLMQPDYKAHIWLFVLEETQDEKWVQLVLDRFDRSKVREIYFNNPNANA